MAHTIANPHMKARVGYIDLPSDINYYGYFSRIYTDSDTDSAHLLIVLKLSLN